MSTFICKLYWVRKNGRLSYPCTLASDLTDYSSPGDEVYEVWETPRGCPTEEKESYAKKVGVIKKSGVIWD